MGKIIKMTFHKVRSLIVAGLSVAFNCASVNAHLSE